MGKNDKRKEYKIADPLIQLDSILKQQSKYKLGEKGYSFYDNKHLKPVFAFDYISLNATELCYNSSRLDARDYIGLLEGLKKISSYSYNDLKVTPSFRFHSIDFDSHKVSISKNDFKKILTHKNELLKDEELPTLYQFDLQYVQAARAVVFYIKAFFTLFGMIDTTQFIQENNLKILNEKNTYSKQG